MPRDLPLGNGALLVNFDCQGQLRDFYWPHVGQENHTPDHILRFGVWVDGVFSWTYDPAWQRTLRYLPRTLVAEITFHHPDLQLRLVCHDAVDFHEDLYVREVTVHDQSGQAREVRLFFAQSLSISGTDVGDSAYYEPERRAVLHYKYKRWFLINGARPEGERWRDGVDQWAVGVKGIGGLEGTWRDAEDGVLSGNAVAQGSVDSVVALHADVPPGGEARAWYWIAVGEDFATVRTLNRAVRAKGPMTFLHRTEHYWSLWCSADGEVDDGLPEDLREFYYHSLLILQTQTDEHGAIIAATDNDITSFSRDTYSYMWPRDAALVVAAFIEAGFMEVPRLFFDFCHQLITPEGYLLHKYNPDGSLASSWHAWLQDGQKALPVQEDETALVVWALWRHFARFRAVEFVRPLYRGLVIRAANWLASYRDPQTGLPQPSWDLWEERRGVLAWTVGATWAGLQAGARFAEAFGERDLAGRYLAAAAEVREGALRHLWSDEHGHFARLGSQRADGTWELDTVVDASLVGLWLFGMLPPDDPQVVATMQAIESKLWVQTDVGGVARYEGDPYQRVVDPSPEVPGNPWFICTLWLAQWRIATARTLEDLRPAEEAFRWARDRALASGVMAEQVDPLTGAPLSVSPLTWSHATLVMAMREYVERRRLIGG